MAAGFRITRFAWASGGFLLAAAVVVAGLSLRRTTPADALRADGREAIAVLDFAAAFDAASPPRGWFHRKFWFTPPMQVAFVSHQGETALRCETNASGSILGRTTDIDLRALPQLTWRWLVEVPVSSARDERTREGDDHPVRLFVEMADSDGGRHAAEIIWGNTALKRGDTKLIGSFFHLVADGGAENVGRWRDETVDLGELYGRFTGRADIPRLTGIAVFCDSDNTGGHSVAYTSNVRLGPRP